MLCAHHNRLFAWLAVVVVLAGFSRGDEPVGPVVVAGAVNFELDVLPVLTAKGCNAGACHGKSRGQNGFQLSLLGFDPDFDFAAIVEQGHGRRVFPAAPENSLLLRKASLRLPHGGGERLTPGSRGIRDGAALDRWGHGGQAAGAPTLQRITVEPAEHVMTPGASERLHVMAHYSDQSIREVTALSDFQSSEPGVLLVEAERGAVKAGAGWRVDRDGSIYEPHRDVEHGDSIRGLGRRGAVCAAAAHELHRWRGVGQAGPAGHPAERAGIGQHIFAARVSGRHRPAADARRGPHVLGQPREQQARGVDRRAARAGRVCRLLGQQVGGSLRPNPYRVGIKPTMSFDAWIRDAFRRNLPYDRFLRELITARGARWRNGAATLFRDRRTPDEITPIVGQLFLGIRLECAKCHHHPFEVWSQDDFYSLAAYFARVTHKGEGISPPISGGEEIVFVAPTGSVVHPITQKVLEPKPLFGTARAIEAGEDPREVLADWITSEANPYFAQVAVNRVWADLMGRGLVDPVDDLRATNPPSNAALLAALADDFRRQGYDMKKLLRGILTSYAYALSSVPNTSNVPDTRNYARHYRQRLRAEVLLDAVCDVTQMPEELAGMPGGSRSIEIWTHRVGSLFLDAFGRPDANQDPPYERCRRRRSCKHCI